MHITKTTTIVLFLFVFLQVTEYFCIADDSISSKEASIHEKIYYFQHLLLPQWTFESKGAFFDDLMHDHPDTLIKAASEIVGEEFSQKLSVRKYNEFNGVLLTFQTPNETPECYFIYIVKEKDGFKLYTYEKTMDLFGSGNKGVVGGWSADGKHSNFGPRKYDDADSFITELQKTQ
jgi:hypothetical protein